MGNGLTTFPQLLKQLGFVAEIRHNPGPITCTFRKTKRWFPCRTLVGRKQLDHEAHGAISPVWNDLWNM
jgi:hypothetical protein